MKFIIHYDGEYEDSIAVEGESIEEIREQAFKEGDKRGWDKKDCWSERFNEEEEE